MAFKIPRLCTSISVSGSATLRCLADGAGDATTAAIAEAIYWGDPIYAGQTPTSDAVCLATRVAWLVEQLHGSLGTTVDWNGGGDFVRFVAIDASLYEVSFNFTHAGSTQAAKDAMARLGFDILGSDVWDNAGPGGFERLPSTNWSPGVAESFDLDLRPIGFGVTNHSHNGKAYGLNLGDPRHLRTITLRGLDGGLVKMRSSIIDTSFERCVWMPAQAGEKIRLWRDINATNTFLTAAMTATQRTAVLSSVTGFAAGEHACINGEIAYIESINVGTKTLTLFRPQPVAHEKYDPVSDDHVGTYVLSRAGMKEIDDERRGPEQDRWDLDIELESAA